MLCQRSRQKAAKGAASESKSLFWMSLGILEAPETTRRVFLGGDRMRHVLLAEPPRAKSYNNKFDVRRWHRDALCFASSDCKGEAQAKAKACFGCPSESDRGDDEEKPIA